MDDPGSGPGTHLTWSNVGLGFSFILIDATVSSVYGLGVGRALTTAAVRCVTQLAIVALLLQRVFETQNPWAVAGIALLLNVMGTFETVVNKSKKRYHHMFFVVLTGMLGSTIPVSLIGVRFAMSIQPVWKPEQYIPIVGMLCGSSISGVVIALGYILKELHENRDKVEAYLAFGASKTEACSPIMKEGLRLALTPTINQMSVIGLIAIPGMMTGALLGGASVEQAAKLQMVIMFMISASTALATIVTTTMTLNVVVDGDHRVRSDRIDTRPHTIWRARDRLLGKISEGIKSVFAKVSEPLRRRRSTDGSNDEQRERLLG